MDVPVAVAADAGTIAVVAAAAAAADLVVAAAVRRPRYFLIHSQGVEAVSSVADPLRPA